MAKNYLLRTGARNFACVREASPACEKLRVRAGSFAQVREYSPTCVNFAYAQAFNPGPACPR